MIIARDAGENNRKHGYDIEEWGDISAYAEQYGLAEDAFEEDTQVLVYIQEGTDGIMRHRKVIGPAELHAALWRAGLL